VKPYTKPYNVVLGSPIVQTVGPINQRLFIYEESLQGLPNVEAGSASIQGTEPLSLCEEEEANLASAAATRLRGRARSNKWREVKVIWIV
jgi:hypothetical protein